MLDEILSGEVPEVEIAALLAVLATRGEQAPELAGFVEVMRARAIRFRLTDEERAELVDTSAPAAAGRSPSTSLRVRRWWPLPRAPKWPSTAIAPSPRWRGRRTCLKRSACPSTLGPELAAECLRETGFMFLFAPLYHPAMKAVGPLRRALGFRTIFNLCGPLTNPAGARAQVIGVLAPSRVLLVGRTLVALGAKRAFVVHGTDGIDELTTTGESVVARIEESETGGRRR